MRWTGFSNFELAYEGKILLLDAYFDRGRDYPPLGFAAADVKKADAIIIGHGHSDHMSDAASVGIRTGAPLVGAALTTDVLKSERVPASQIRTVTGQGRRTAAVRRLPGAADTRFAGREWLRAETVEIEASPINAKHIHWLIDQPAFVGQCQTKSFVHIVSAGSLARECKGHRTANE